MCGICGVVYFESARGVSREMLQAMNDQIVHRGPDDAGYFVTHEVGLAMRRLSIIDLATGQQPIANEDGSIHIVFNGEIYNHRELRSTLEANHSYRTHSDTETIVHAYEQYGADCVKALRGMFAFAIWDAFRQRLFLARDRLGIKPLYYLVERDRMLFASEIKSIVAVARNRPRINTQSLPEYLGFGYLSSEETMYAGIKKLMPGCRMEVDLDGAIKIDQYWEVPESAADDEPPRHNYVVSYRQMLEESIRSHLMSDVPLGVFLSGGLDSSSVAAITAKLRGDRIKTFAVGYAEQQYSELGYAREASQHIGTEHHEVRLSRNEFFAALPKLIWHEDEPIVWPSSVSLFFVAQLAREHVKVVLTGEGSDETLAGYTRYAWTLKNARLDTFYRKALPAGVRDRIRRAANSSWLPISLRRKLSHTFLNTNGQSWRSFYFDNFFCAFSEEQQASILSPDILADAHSQYENLLGLWEQTTGDLLSRMLATDRKSYLVELLMKQDNMSMAASIESRVPFLDHVLVEFAAKIPSSVQVHGLSGKHVLKEAIGDLLPRSITYRKKLGFPTPLHAWLAGPELANISRLLKRGALVEQKFIQSEGLARLLEEHTLGKFDHTDRIWRLLNLEHWLRVCIYSERPWAAAEPSTGAHIVAHRTH